MRTRCKPGDIAIIAYDTPICAENIGRIVSVRGPSRIDAWGYLTWLITPVNQEEPYLIEGRNGSTRFMALDDTDIEHRDIWMLPVKTGGFNETEDEFEELEA